MSEAVAYDGLGAGAQSLIDAFARGEVFSPAFFASWLQAARAQGRAALRPILEAGPEQGPEQGAPAGALVIDAETIRQALLGKITLESGASLQIDERGARMDGVRVTGQLDLTAAIFPKPILFENCVFENGLILEDAKLGRLSLRGSTVPWLMGAMVEVDGDLGLHDIKGCARIDLDRAHIDGLLNLHGTVLSGAGGTALSCNAARIGGSVFLRNGFRATGEVNFVGAEIGGQLACVEGAFTNETGRALYCDAAKIGADVHLSEGFRATGEVNFRGAEIGGQLACVEGTFTNETGRALNCGAAKIGGSVFLREGFCATGEVNFIRAKIGGYFQCWEGAFDSGDGEMALNLQSARIEADLQLTDLAGFKGDLDLRDAAAKGLAEDGSLAKDPETKKKRPDVTVHLDRFTYDTLADNDFTRAKTNRGSRARRAFLHLQPAECLNHGFRPQPFTQCAKVLRAMGHSEDARALLFERERLALGHKNIGWIKRFFLWWLGALAGYGYKRSRAFYALVSIWGLGWVIFGLAHQMGLMRPASDQVLTSAPFSETGVPPQGYEPLKAWIYSADVLVPLADFAQERYWLPSDGGEKSPGFELLLPALPQAPWAAALRWTVSWMPKLYFWFEMAAGWLLTTIVVAGFSGLLGHEQDE